MTETVLQISVGSNFFDKQGYESDRVIFLQALDSFFRPEDVKLIAGVA